MPEMLLSEALHTLAEKTPSRWVRALTVTYGTKDFTIK